MAMGVLGALLAGLVPASTVYGLDTGSSDVTFAKAPGSTLYNTDLLFGTVSDTDGVQSVSLALYAASTNSPISSEMPAALDGTGNWSVQLTKSVLSPIDLANPGVSVIVTVTDQQANVSNVSFTPYVYTVSELEIFHQVTEVLSGLDADSCALSAALQAASPLTVFGPNNQALQALPADELQALLDNPDELCAVVSSHVTPGSIASTDISDPVVVPTIQPNSQDLSVDPTSGAVVANGATVVNADNPVVNGGLLHVVDALINPVSNAVDIDALATSSSSPALYGTVEDADAIVTIRVNGVSYQAINNGDGTWTLPAGLLSIDPTNNATLFTVVARKAVPTSTPGVYQLQLLGITMRSKIVSYVAPVVASTAIVSAVSTSTSAPVVAPVAVCDADCQAAGQTSSTSVSVDGETTAKVPTSSDDADKPEETKKETSSQWYWWLIGIATLGALYYVLGGGSAAKE